MHYEIMNGICECINVRSNTYKYLVEIIFLTQFDISV